MKACFLVIPILVLMLTSTAALPQGMSADVHRVIESANDLLEHGDPQHAINELENLSRRDNLNDYERAVTRQILGFAWYNLDNTGRAREAFESALSFDALPEDVATGVTIVLAQVCMGDGDLECARENVDRVVESTDDPDPDHLGIAAYIYYELELYDIAERHVLTAIDASDSPAENWYQILLAIYRAQEAWHKAEDTLRDVIARHPDNGNYWQFFSYVLFAREKMHEALAALMLAWRLDLVDSGDMERIVGFHANLGIPEKAARLLGEWLETGTLESSTERVSTLGRLWLMARERDKAVEQLARAAGEATDGGFDLLLGKLHYEDQRWEKSMQHLETALSKNGLTDHEAAEAYLLLGISAYHSGYKDTAVSAFEQAQRSSRYADHARYWLNRLEEEAANS